MKLLYVIPEYPPHFGGGIGSVYASLLPAMTARGHQVHTIVGSALSHAFNAYEDSGVAVSALDVDRVDAFESRFDRYAMFPLLRRHLAAAWSAWEQAKRGEGFDVVETTDWGLLFVPWMVNSATRVKVQLHGSIGQIALHEPQQKDSAEAELARLIEVGCLRGADRLQTYSRSNQRHWEALLGRPVSCISPPVPLIGRKVAHRNGEIAGVVVGRVQSWKGAHLLCQTMRLLANRAPLVRWIGRDTPGRSGTSLARELAEEFPDVWDKTVIPMGQRSPEETRALISEAGFGIVPSSWDVFNLAAAEMMSAGLVVLCSRGAGAGELIIDTENGLQFEQENAESLANCIRHVLGLSPLEREQIGAAARDMIATKLNPSVIAEEHIRSFHDLINEPRVPGPRVNAWTAAAVSPGSGSGDELDFLDQLPFRKLATYVARRAADKLSLRK